MKRHNEYFKARVNAVCYVGTKPDKRSISHNKTSCDSIDVLLTGGIINSFRLLSNKAGQKPAIVIIYLNKKCDTILDEPKRPLPAAPIGSSAEAVPGSGVLSPFKLGGLFADATKMIALARGRFDTKVL